MSKASRLSSTFRHRSPVLRPTWVILLSLFAITHACANEGFRVDRRRQKAIEFEKRGAWLEACRAYDDILRRDRTNSYARDGYQRCLRRLHLTTRHGDPLYRQTIQRLSPTDALETYEQVLSIVNVAYPDRTRTSFALLFQQGIQEVQLALEDARFRSFYFPGVKPAAIAAFKTRLAGWSTSKILTRFDARDQLRALIRSASKDGIPIRPAFASAIGMEFAAGACNALDEHSSFVSPGTLAMIQAAMRGKLASIGAEIGIIDEKVQITRVLDKSPAKEAGLLVGDELLSVGGESIEDYPAEAVAERLRGVPGSKIEIRIRDRAPLTLTRRTIPLPSVEYQTVTLPKGALAGHIRINHFQETTLQEVKEALASMSPMGDSLKGLIIDLRGNPGGVFKSALSISELFLPEGIIVVGQSPFKQYNGPFKVEGAGTLLLPVVVLIDGDTASAAEVLAVALKEGRVARAPTVVMGQTSFGKGSVQCLIPLDKAPLLKLAGIRLTVAKLLTPSGQPWSGRGITPDVIVAADVPALDEALKQLELVLERTMAMPMTMPKPAY